jgi:hypothetical protein
VYSENPRPFSASMEILVFSLMFPSTRDIIDEILTILQNSRLREERKRYAKEQKKETPQDR